MIEKNHQKPKSFFTLLLVLMPIINQYQLFSLTCWEIYATILVIYGILNTKGKITISMDRMYVYFCVYICIGYLCSIMFYPDLQISTAILRLLKFIIVSIAIIAVVYRYIFDINIVKKYYRYVLLIVSGLLIIQLVAYYILGRQIYPIIPNLILNYNDGINSTQYINSNISQIAGGYYFRPSSVFIEPAHYALFALPGIILELFEDNFSKKNMIFASIFTVCVILTTSSMALMGCAICWFLFIMKRKDLWKRKFTWMSSMVTVAIPVAIYYLLQNSAVITTIGIKLAGLNNLSESSSTSLRLVRGLQYYRNMGGIQQLFGVGYGNLTAYYLKSRMDILGFGKIGQASYMNGFSTILCSFGVVGFVLFLGAMFRMYKKSDLIGKTMIIVFCVSMMICDMFDSVIYYLFLIVMVMLLHRGDISIKCR